MGLRGACRRRDEEIIVGKGGEVSGSVVKLGGSFRRCSKVMGILSFCRCMRQFAEYFFLNLRNF